MATCILLETGTSSDTNNFIGTLVIRRVFMIKEDSHFADENGYGRFSQNLLLVILHCVQ